MVDVRHGRAYVLGDRDLLASIHRAGVPVTAVCRRTAPARFSRYTSRWLEDSRPEEDALSATLREDAGRVTGPAVLFYEQDDDLLFVSRRREELSGALRFVIAEAHLVERLMDKGAFQALAEELDLPVPVGRRVDLTGSSPDLRGISYPVLVKPLRREQAWERVSATKAVLASGPEELAELGKRLAPGHAGVLVQQPVAGPETRIESYHVYVDAAGEIVAEFTGRKIRTYPSELGHSTALVTTDCADVVSLGRDIVRKLGLRGVAKLDFKRDPEDRLWLLEVNPRFTLWHHVAAAAGLNIPAIVWADLTGGARPPAARARAGVRWCRVERDVLAARQEGMGLAAWLRWLSHCETRAGLDPLDPVPVLSKMVMPAYERARRLVHRGR